MPANSVDFDKQLKGKLLEMIKWFHGFCVENSLRYYVLGGTMLGAVRHKGFIPWDDDIDVGMPRKDYEKLAYLMGKQVCGIYVIETPTSEDKGFLYTFSKIYDTTTTLVENTRIPLRRGIYIDVFPLDGLGSSLKESKKKYHKIDLYFKLLLTRATGIRKGRNPLKNLAVATVGLIPGFLINNKKLQRFIDKLCKENDYDECLYGGNLLGAWRFKEVMESRIMGTPVLYPFEDIMVYGAEYYDDYLTHLYGDWKKLPPQEKRVTHHDYLECDLEKSYLHEL